MHRMQGLYTLQLGNNTQFQLWNGLSRLSARVKSCVLTVSPPPPPLICRQKYCANASMALRILKPTGFASLTSSILIYLYRSTMAAGLQTWVRVRTLALWPHEIFACLWDFHPTAFFRYILGGDRENVGKFWDMMPTRVGVDTRDDYRTHCVPLGLHGDSVSVANIRGVAGKGVECLNWTSLLSTGPTRLTIFSLWFVCSHLTKPSGFGSTWSTFWKKLSASLRALWAPDCGQRRTWRARWMHGEVNHSREDIGQ